MPSILAAALAATLTLTAGFVPPSRPRPHGVPASLRPAAPAGPEPSVVGLPPTTLHDATVMQSMGFDTTNRVWVFAQVMAGGRFGQSYTTHRTNGDLTLTMVSTSGRTLGYMYLLGFSHGGAIGVQGFGAATHVWLGAGHLAASAHPVGIETAGGVMTANVTWRNSATVRPSDAAVERFGDNAGQPFQAPAVNVAADLIAVRYYSRALKVIRWAVYRLSEFARHRYAALSRFTVPADAFRPNLQAWAPTAGHVLALTGAAYGTSNPPPGDTVLLDVDAGSAAVVSSLAISAGAALEYREPEGLIALPGNLCLGFASGPGGARVADVYCRRAV